MCWVMAGTAALYAQQPKTSAAPIIAQGEETYAETLLSRVATPSPLAVEVFKHAGMQGVTPHLLTDRERGKIAAALAVLPELNRHVLASRLHALAFVDGIPGEGTGLTSPAAQPGMFDITLRASVIDEPLSQFLTIKENRVFSHSDSGIAVKVTGTGTNALGYVLLHESSHVVDKTCGITGAATSGFDIGMWTSYKDLVPALAAITPKTHFRGGSPLALAQAAAIYDALSKTPFVSLYSTASREEDFAELVAWREMSQAHQADLVITVDNARNGEQRQWRPLSFPGVRARFAQLEKLYASPIGCRGRW